jgi:hypothetical protein
VDQHTEQRVDYFDCIASENTAKQIGDSVALLFMGIIVDTISGAVAAGK